jgi:hypothetical protein
VVDEHDSGGVQQPLGDDQGPDHVVGDDPAGVADDVRVPRLQPEHRIDVQPCVHAGDDRDTSARASGEITVSELPGAVSGVRQESVDTVHAGPFHLLG